MLLLATIRLDGADLALFEAYEARVLPLVYLHGGRVLWRLRDLDAARESHLLRFPTPEAWDRFHNDPRRLALAADWQASGAVAHVVEVAEVPLPPL